MDTAAFGGTFGIEAPDPLTLRYLPGRGRNLVVSFTGVGRAGGPQTLEFRGTASDGGANHVLFVVDRSRSWLSAPGLAERIEAAITQVAAGIEDCRITLLGNSMGGFMALRMAERVPASSVLAFAPQYSPHGSDVPEERRWPQYRGALREGAARRIDRIDTSGRMVAILHGDAPDELIHARRFPVAPGLRHFILPRGRHLLPEQLKRRGHLGEIVGHAVAGRPVRLSRMLRRIGFVPRSRSVPYETPALAA